MNDLQKIFEVIVAFNSEKDYLKLLKIILTKMMEITNADAGTLYIIEDNKLHFRIMRTISMNVYQSEDEITLPPIALDERNITNISAYSAIRNEIVNIEEVYDNTKFNFTGPKNYDKITGYRTKSMLVMPLTATFNESEEVIGVIQLINSIDPETGEIMAFGDIYDPPVLPALSNISANTLANLLYTKEINELFNSFVSVMTQAIDERSPYNNNHTKNVAEYSEKFADYLSAKFPKGHKYHFDSNRREQLVMASLLHDIGKIITPLNIMDKPDRLESQIHAIRYRFEIKKYQVEIDYLNNRISKQQYEDIIAEHSRALALIEASNAVGFLPSETIDQLKQLAKLTYVDANGATVPILTADNMDAITIQKGTLTEAERRIMQEHVSLTARLLEKMTFRKNYKCVPAWAGGHHELLDGSGYPKGLTAEDIPTEVRILSMTDIYDALTANDRPYKKAMPAQRALDVLSSMVSEGKLDKEIVDMFAESRVWDKNNDSQS